MLGIDVVFPHRDDDDVDIIATFGFDGTNIIILKDTNGFAKEILDDGIVYQRKSYSTANPKEFFDALPQILDGRRVYATLPYQIGGTS